MEKTDRLSKRPDQKVGIENNNSNQEFIKNYQICNLSKVVIEGPEIDILEKIKIARSKNEEVVRVVKEIKKVEVKALKEEEWQIEKDLVFKKRKIYMPKNKVLRIEIIWLYHNVLVVGYRGKWKMIELVMRNYWWLEVTKDMGKYVKECNVYQRMKNRAKTSAGKLMMNK